MCGVRGMHACVVCMCAGRGFLSMDEHQLTQAPFSGERCLLVAVGQPLRTLLASAPATLPSTAEVSLLHALWSLFYHT